VKILITGGAGFIGSHLAEILLQDGHQVSVLDDLSTGRLLNLSKVLDFENFTFIEGSILDNEKLTGLISKSDYVFHLAAAVGVFNIMNKPLQSLLINIRGTENVMEAASKVKVPVFLTSSSEVYGKNVSDSLSESDDRILGSPTTLRWSYSEAKAIDESLAFAYFIEKELEVRIVRFFNTVGPRQLGNYGMVIPRFVEAALKNEPLEIFGSGEQTRCFVHIYDVVEAIISVAFSENTIAKVINIGNDTEISIQDLARKVVEETKSKSEIIKIDYLDAYGSGFEDMERRVPNIQLIKELVNWQPKRNLTTIISDLAEEMRKSI
jgi:UDP-glucose 4-epimerase